MNRAEAERDFRNFLFYVWKQLNLPAPTRIQYDIAHCLQHGNGLQEPQYRIIEAFRGIGKSWITSAYVLWLLLRDPQEKILVSSASADRSNSFSTFTKRLIHELPMLSHLKPNAKMGHRDSNIMFDVGSSAAAHAPSVKSVGIFGMLTGSRATRIIGDDVEVKKNALSHNMREQLWETVKEFDSIILPSELTEITYLGTPQVEQTLYNELRTNRGYDRRIWTSEIPDEQWMEAHGHDLAPIIQDMMNNGAQTHDPVDPERFDALYLNQKKAKVGKHYYALQFMLDTNVSNIDQFPLKLSDLIVMDIDQELAPNKVVYASDDEHSIQDIPNVGLVGDRLYRPMHVSDDYYPYTGRAMHIDPSGRGQDETAYAITLFLNGMIFLAEVGGFKGTGYDPVVMNKLAERAKHWSVNKIEIESNFGDGMYTKLFTPVLHKVHPCAVEEISHHTNKERRICDTLEPVLNSHRLIVSPDQIRSDYKSTESTDEQFFYQLTRMTRVKGCLKHDDRIDVVAMAVKHWVDNMSIDVDKAAAKKKAKWLEAQINDFSKGITTRTALGYAPRKSSSSKKFTKGSTGSKSFVKPR